MYRIYVCAYVGLARHACMCAHDLQGSRAPGLQGYYHIHIHIRISPSLPPSIPPSHDPVQKFEGVDLFRAYRHVHTCTYVYVYRVCVCVCVHATTPRHATPSIVHTNTTSVRACVRYHIHSVQTPCMCAEISATGWMNLRDEIDVRTYVCYR